MIYYDTLGHRQLSFIFQLKGSVFPFALSIALPSALLSGLFKSLHTIGYMPEWTNMQLLATNGGTGAWGGFNFLVGFVIVFRTSQAYGRFWDALNDTHKMLAEWFDAASCIAAFTRFNEEAESRDVEIFMHKMMRLFSMLSASALQELSDIGEHKVWGLETLDSSAIDIDSISSLDRSRCRVELLYQWIQQSIVEDLARGVLKTVPPPVAGRCFSELSAGMTKFQDAMKHAKVPFPFPYAQTTTVLLIFHWVLTPIVMVQWSGWTSGATVFTFVQVFTLWSLNAIAQGFEKPFMGQDNDIDPIPLQEWMNTQLINLMEPRTRRTPTIDPATFLDVEVLRKRDTIHRSALLGEGWELKSLKATPSMLYDMDEEFKFRLCGWFCKCCCRLWCCFCSNTCQRRCCWCLRRRSEETRAKVAVSMRYSQKRYGVVDGKRTAVLTVGIFKNEIVVALPVGPEMKASHVFRVTNLKEELCNVRMRKLPINERHGFLKVAPPAWNEEYCDFPSGYNFRAEELVNAYTSQESSKVTTAPSAVKGGPVKSEDLEAEDAVEQAEEPGKPLDIETELKATEEGEPVSPLPPPPGGAVPTVVINVGSEVSGPEGSPGEVSAAPLGYARSGSGPLKRNHTLKLSGTVTSLDLEAAGGASPRSPDASLVLAEALPSEAGGGGSRGSVKRIVSKSRTLTFAMPGDAAAVPTPSPRSPASSAAIGPVHSTGRPNGDGTRASRASSMMLKASKSMESLGGGLDDVGGHVVPWGEEAPTALTTAEDKLDVDEVGGIVVPWGEEAPTAEAIAAAMETRRISLQRPAAPEEEPPPLQPQIDGQSASSGGGSEDEGRLLDADARQKKDRAEDTEAKPWDSEEQEGLAAKVAADDRETAGVATDTGRQQPNPPSAADEADDDVSPLPGIPGSIQPGLDEDEDSRDLVVTSFSCQTLFKPTDVS
eukprot:TRINITY_DN22231_c0_g1_i1.p1 TRINITY_DN22231_c0_g1~~TRINITY_DN22231_c0_g1_i1.p1  ORF type:complete len:940 (-),score=241.92 TRINITY_DN22231_c0_g1_i1:303-3122(-)